MEILIFWIPIDVHVRKARSDYLRTLVGALSNFLVKDWLLLLFSLVVGAHPLLLAAKFVSFLLAFLRVHLQTGACYPAYTYHYLLILVLS